MHIHALALAYHPTTVDVITTAPGNMSYDMILQNFPSVLWRCWLGGSKGIRPVKMTAWWGAGVGICLGRGADLHMAQLMPLPPTVSCSSKIQIGFTFLVLAHPGCYCLWSLLEQCNPWPHVANRHISVSQQLSLWRQSHYDVSRVRRSRRSQPPFSLWRHSHCDVIRYWAGHAHHFRRMNVRTPYGV